ncbi:MAG: hypothetical protein V4512_16280 [Pseudomonadota bacterium]
MARKTKLTESKPQNNALKVSAKKGDNVELATARTILGPDFRHAVSVAQVLKAQFGNMDGAPGFGDYADAIQERGDTATKGELAFVSRALAAQAMTLDTIFTEMARRMALNMGDYLGATETYGRIAMKAQAQSRATLEALAKLHQPREQTVRHVHVNEGGQAVIADQFHHHTGGSKNGKTDDQSHATGAAGVGPALLCTDPFRNEMPISSRERAEAVPNARGHESGCA